MTEPTNRNEMPKYSLSKDQLDQLFERNKADLLAERDARRRTAEFPIYVAEILGAMVNTLAAQGERIAALEARLGQTG